MRWADERADVALGTRPSACKANRPVSGRGQGRQPPKAGARSASLGSGRSLVYFNTVAPRRSGLFVTVTCAPERKLDAGVEASGPHDFSVRVGTFRQTAPPASTASRPAFVTCATPLCGGGMAGMSEVIWVRREAECFCEGDWTGQITLIRLKKSAFCRKSRKRVTASKRSCSRSH
jgi:hypothetical protein